MSETESCFHQGKDIAGIYEIFFMQNILRNTKILLVLIALTLSISCDTHKEPTLKDSYVFSKDNLIPWSIVSFDVKKRTPEQRLEMLQQLGFDQYAYGNRSEHQATMLPELRLAKEKNITVKAVWMYINLSKDKVGQLKPHSEAIFKALKEAGLQTQIWVGFQPDYFNDLSAQDALQQTIKMIEYLSTRANLIGCKIALYNHGGWFGDSKNQLKIIKSLPKQDIGIIFNFHHAHQHLDTFRQDIKQMLPYLWSVNLNGMNEEGPKIITVGKGNLEKEMIQYILDLGYQGPFGILGHVKGGDAKEILQQNYLGLHMLFPGQAQKNNN